MSSDLTKVLDFIIGNLRPDDQVYARRQVQKIIEAGYGWILEIELQLYDLARMHLILTNTVARLKNLYDKAIRSGRYIYTKDYFDTVIKALKNIDTETRSKDSIVSMMDRLIIKHPVYTYYLSKLPGIGKILSGMILGMIMPWRYSSVSKLWAHAGLAPPDYYKSGAKYNKRLKAVAMQAAVHLKKNCELYGALYEDFYRHELAKLRGVEEPRRAEKHAKMRALRKVAKVFLSHYWEAYRIILRCKYGIELDHVEPFVKTTLKHQTIEPAVVVEQPVQHPYYLPPSVKTRAWMDLKTYLGCKEG